MKARSVILAAYALLPLSPAIAQDAVATIKAAEYALGMIRSAQRIDAINTLEYWGTGSAYAAGQALKVTYHASLSYAVPAMRVDVTRGNPNGGGPQRQIEVVSGPYAWNESVPGAGFIAGSTATPTPGDLNDRLLRLWTTPFGVLKMAERAGANAKVTREDGATVLTFPLQERLSTITVKLTLNAKNQPERVETLASKLVTEITYSDYKDLGEIPSDVQFPSRIVEKQNGSPVLDLTITKTDANNPYVVFPVPDAVEKGK